MTDDKRKFNWDKAKPNPYAKPASDKREELAEAFALAVRHKIRPPDDIATGTHNLSVQGFLAGYVSRDAEVAEMKAMLENEHISDIAWLERIHRAEKDRDAWKEQALVLAEALNEVVNCFVSRTYQGGYVEDKTIKESAESALTAFDEWRGKR